MVVFLASVAQAQTVVTANPPAIDFGTLYPTNFDTQTIVYTCATGPCVGAETKTTEHKIIASDNTCKTTWLEATPGETGSTCSVSWTFLANAAEVSCPSDVCTGAVAISVGDGHGGAAVASDTYTATVLSPKPTMTFSPASFDFGNIITGLGNVLTLSVTVTNVSNVDENLTWSEKGPGFSVDDPAGSTCAPNLPPGQSCQITVYFTGYTWCGACPDAPGTESNHGMLKIWDTSTTPGTPSNSDYVGTVALSGTSTPNPVPPPPPGAQITASPTVVSFGTMYPGQFDSETVTYTCLVAPCIWRADEIKGGVVASDNTCKSSWVRYNTVNGSTCVVTWTFLADTAEVNCPASTCAGSMGIKVVDPLASGEYVGTASSTYTATVLSPKPSVTISPKKINFGELNENANEGGPVPVTITNVSEVSVNVSYCIVESTYENEEGGNFLAGLNSGTAGPVCPSMNAVPISLTPGQVATLDTYFFTDEGNCPNNSPCTKTNAGTLRIWTTSTTPGTSTKTYFEGSVALLGTSQFYPD